MSILIATWNRPQTIGQGIQSVLDQDFKDWELIIAGDGPAPDVEAVIKEWAKKDVRIKYVRVEHVGRISVVSNAALKIARGEFVAVLDDDDWWPDKQKLSRQVAFLDAHPDYIGTGAGFIVVDKDGKERSRVLKPETDEAIRAMALYANPMANSTGMFRRAEAGLYDEGMPQFADWDFWLKLGTKGKLYNFPDYLLAYRMWGEGSSFLYQRENADAAVKIVARYRHAYPGFVKAVILVRLYWWYSRLPSFVRNALNGTLSRLKKAIFSGRASQ